MDTLELKVLQFLSLNNLDLNIPPVKRLLENFLSLFGFDITEDDLNKLLHHVGLDENAKDILNALLILKKKSKKIFTKENALSLYQLTYTINDNGERNENIKSLPSDRKIQLIDYLISVFEEEEETYIYKNDNSSSLYSFCTREALFLLTMDENIKLLELNRSNKNWSNRILHHINEVQQKTANLLYQSYDISKIKDYIINEATLSSSDFFIETYTDIISFKNIIEANRNNDKEEFYKIKNGKFSPLTENECRTNLQRRLIDKYGKKSLFEREQEISDNRVDLNVKYKKCLEYEVQIECKRDDNTALYTGLQNQLIDKYLSEGLGIKFGIYLIFYFGYLKDSDKMISKILYPLDYRNKIKIVLIDLRMTKKVEL